MRAFPEITLDFQHGCSSLVGINPSVQTHFSLEEALVGDQGPLVLRMQQHLGATNGRYANHLSRVDSFVCLLVILCGALGG